MNETTHEDATRYRKLVALLQRAYEGDDVEDGLTITASMMSAYKSFETVQATLTWTGERGEQIDLDTVLDQIEL